MMKRTLEDCIGNTPLVRLQRLPGRENEKNGNLILAKLDEIFPGHGISPSDAVHDLSIGRRQMVEIELRLGLADPGVHVLEHRDVELLLAAEVVVDERPGGMGARGDRIHARPLEAARRELVDRGLDDARPVGLRGLGLAHRHAAAGLGSWN